MINYEKFELNNGLKVIFHKDKNTPIATINLIYNVGAKDENPEKTGWAHLLEHLMFEGSVNIERFDLELEKAGGTNNAFTNEDYTNYYINIPKNNLEVALWLESDRMLKLKFDDERFNTQKNVVIEEFKQTTLNEPYGDDLMNLMSLAYKKHPYQWTTIGKKISHIQKADITQISEFYNSHYSTNNAILSIGGDFEFDYIKQVVNKWFGDIKPKTVKQRNLPIEPIQKQRRFKEIERNVPYDKLYMGFHYDRRMSKEFYIADILTDILDDGKSSRLYQHLMNQNHVFDDVDAFITGSIENGLVILEAQPKQGTSLEQAEDFIWNELNDLKNKPVDDRELEKTFNSVEFSNNFIETSIYQKTRSLGFFELLGNCELLNSDLERYKQISKKDIMEFSNNIFTQNNANILHYKAKK